MNAGITSDEIKTFCDLLTKANDAQIKMLRSVTEGEDKGDFCDWMCSTCTDTHPRRLQITVLLEQYWANKEVRE